MEQIPAELCQKRECSQLGKVGTVVRNPVYQKEHSVVVKLMVSLNYAEQLLGNHYQMTHTIILTHKVGGIAVDKTNHLSKEDKPLQLIG